MSKPLRVLIIEDSESDAMLLLMELRRGGYDPSFKRVETPEAMASALDEVKWDIVISDYVMPRFGGLEALDLLKSKGLDIPFIIVSGVISEETAVSAMRAGAKDYITKGKLARLLPAIERELHEFEMRRERRLSEFARMRSEEKFKALFDQASDCIFLMDPDGHGSPLIVDANKAACTMHGYEKDELLGKPITELDDPETSEHVPERVERLMSGENVSFEGNHMRKDGTVFPVEVSTRLIDIGGKPFILAIDRDITMRKQAEEALRRSEERLQNIVENAGDAIFVHDPDGRIVDVNQRACQSLGYSRDELLNLSVPDVEAEFDEGKHPEIWEEMSPGNPITFEGVHRRKDGTTFPVEIRLGLFESGERQLFLALVRDITERKKAEQQLAYSEGYLRSIIEAEPECVKLLSPEGVLLEINTAGLKIIETERAEDIIGQSVLPLLMPGHEEPFRALLKDVCKGNKGWLQFEIRGIKGTCRWLETHAVPFYGEANGRAVMLAITHDITERRKMEEAIIQSKQDWEDTFDTISDMITIHDMDFNMTRANKTARETLNLPDLEFEHLKCFKRLHGTDSPPDACPALQSLKSGEESVLEVFEPHLDTFVEIRAIPRYDSDSKITGFIHVVRDISERKRAEERIRTHVEHLTALRTIDMAITESLDMTVTLNVLLRQVSSQLKVDAADVMLYNPHTAKLEYAAGTGFRSNTIKDSKIGMGEGCSGVVALERKALTLSNLKEMKGNCVIFDMVEEEEFVSYYGVPLIVKGQVKGVLEVFQRTPLSPDPEWLEFLDALSGQAAIAIDNAVLFSDLQRSRDELVKAYDSTMEGWSRALDYRDKETEGHSRRVTDMTLMIAQALGLSDQDLVHIRRGSLLHDIGKLGVPDNILLKPKALSDTETEAMQRHPEIAYEILSPIEFLRPALDIPYCHHEKWDGSGYPRGLKGEQIPLASRIFTVVDVWDALCSNRPYRPAWSEGDALDHIKSLSGVHFDPKVVEVFLKLLKEPRRLI